MAVDDLDSLHSELPKLFSERELPAAWEEDWVFVKVDNPESALPPEETKALPDHLEDSLFSPNSYGQDIEVDGLWTPFGNFGRIIVPDLPSSARFPGAPVPYDLDEYLPPPDCLGFYLPFHYFYPVWWGVYLVAEGVCELAEFIQRSAGGILTFQESVMVARLFIYGHEAFHHIVESFATRLEVTHRKPLYKTGFDKLNRKCRGTEEAIEEALASAHGYRKVSSLAFRKPRNDRQKREAALEALAEYIRRSPPGYDRAMEFIKNSTFMSQRSGFAEQNHNCALPGIESRENQVWNSFPNAFSGISRVHSRVNYAIHRDSPLGTRISQRGHYLRNREVARRLEKLAACKFVKHGCRHDIWENPYRQRFAVPRHPGDLTTGTLVKIIKEAGLQLSLSEFKSQRV